jgi:hypothetical protein
MADEARDHLGRVTATGDPGPQTVTQFAVEQGTLDADAPGVQEAIEAEEQRAQRGTERAEQVAAVMATGDPDGDTDTVPPEEGGGQG